MIDKIKDDLYKIRFAIVLLAIYCIFMQWVFETVCPFKAITKFPCPGCGLTHATIYLFTGNIKEAFNSNPTVFLWICLIICFFIDRYIYKFKIKIVPIGAIVVSIITLIWYIYKMAVLLNLKVILLNVL